MNTIANIVEERTCTGCGTCTSICPVSCITMEENKKEGIYLPLIDTAKCTNCGLCRKVCPQEDIRITPAWHGDNFYGKNLFSFTGYSTDKDLCYNASSGGLITSLALFALKSGLVDGVISTGSMPDNPFRFEPKICRSEEEIISCRGSKYCPVSLNTSLKNILTESSQSRLMYIGLPCHLKGLSRLCSVRPDLKNKIKYKISIFCSHTPNFHGTDTIIKKLSISEKEIRQFAYRGNGWPGKISIITNSKNYFISSGIYWAKYFANHFFTPKYCFLCDDFYAVESDISLGDAWLDRFTKNKDGVSIGIARTENGRALLENCRKNRDIFIEKISDKEVERSQQGQVIFKRDMLDHRKHLILKTPLHRTISLKSRLHNRFMLLNAALSRKAFFRSFLLGLSDRMENIFFKIINKIKTVFLY